MHGDAMGEYVQKYHLPRNSLKACFALPLRVCEPQGVNDTGRLLYAFRSLDGPGAVLGNGGEHRTRGHHGLDKWQ
jgi:hypothetical protein